MAYFLDRGLTDHSLRDLAVAGILGGVANYTYLASRTLYLLPLLFLVPLMAVALLRRQRTGWWPAFGGRDSFGLLLTLLLMVVVSSPLLSYLAQHPASDGRIQQLSGALNAALHGDLQPVLYNAWDTIRSIVWSGSAALPFYYNVPGRPALQPIPAVCLLLGLGLTLARFRSRHESLLLAVLFLGLSTSLLTGADALQMRAIYALPVIFLLVARGLWFLLSALRTPRLSFGWRVGVRQAPLVPIMVVGGLLLWHAASDGIAYFDTWAHDERTRRIYNADFRAAAAYLDSHAGDEPIFMGTDRLRDLDSLTYGFYEPLREDIHWFSLPDVPSMPSTGDVLYLLPTSAQMPPALAALAPIMRDRFILPAPFGGYDLMQGFRLSANDLANLLKTWGSQPLVQPVIFGDALRLDAAGLRLAGNHAELITSWTVLAPWPRSARPGYPLARPKLSVSLTDNANFRWSQDDVSTALPVLTWQTGERLLEITPVTIPADMAPGDYLVRLSMYDDEQGPLTMRYGDTPIATAPWVTSVRLEAGGFAPVPQPPFRVDGRLDPAPTLRLLGRWEALDQLVVGVPAAVHLSWQAVQSIGTAGLTFRVRAHTGDGSILWEQPADPVQPLPAVWTVDQVLRLAHLLMPTTTQAGVTLTAIEICVQQPDRPEACEEIAETTVVNQPPLMALPRTPEHTCDAHWPGGPMLVGYDLACGGEAISLTLYWQAGAAPVGSLKRFVHAVGPDQIILTQSDDDLQNAGIPAASWRTGEYVVDPVILNVAGGEATTLFVGLYYPETGQRLPVQAAEGAISDNRVVIGLN
jgi:hypothetical protein